MTRPQIIRADTIDLQDHNAPSASDHSRQPTNPAALGDGPPAPHQAHALKSAGFDGLEHHSRSPRASQDLSNKELQLLHDTDGPEHGVIGSGEGGGHGDDGVEDGETDDSMDDDMMDRISSSPSIDNGGYPISWPARETSLSLKPCMEENTPPELVTLCNSQKPLSTVVQPISYLQRPEEECTPAEDHHQGGYFEDQSSLASADDRYESERLDKLGPLIGDSALDYYREEFDAEGEYYYADFDDFLLPMNDPLLEVGFDDCGMDEDVPASSPTSSTGSSLSWSDALPCKHDDDTEDISFDDCRFVDSGWGGECLRETEDIDFEFVYALHTFVATVEGQANATKGDTMVLLDDSNSYWWLVRVVKDSSIGYLPAEHIETPTERLARLNKHRNIDLSQTMLSDSPEKTRNPLKKAMRRRNAKTVAFTDPTYYEPSENEYSTDGEDEEGEYHDGQENGQAQAHVEQQAQQEPAQVEPLRPRVAKRENGSNDEIQVDQSIKPVESTPEPQTEKLQSNDEALDRQDDGVSPGKIRNGIVRNTDSFFKDSIETKKINLTPSLLRDDSSSFVTAEVKEPNARGSLDTDKTLITADRKDDRRKDKKSEKEKKSGMLSGLFKRKDRKSRTQSDEDDPDWLAKEIAQQSAQPKLSSDSVSIEGPQTPTSPQKGQLQRQTSKLQKIPPPKQASGLKRSSSGEGQNQYSNLGDGSKFGLLSPNRGTPASEANPAHQSRAYDSAQPGNEGASTRLDTQQTQDNNTSVSPSPSRARGVLSPIRDVLRHNSSSEKPERVKKAKVRMTIDDSDSSGSEYPPTQTHGQQQQAQQEHPYPQSKQALESQRHQNAPNQSKERLSESPVHVSPVVATSNPPALDDSPSSQDDGANSPASPSSTPELVDLPEDPGAHQENATPASTVHSRQTPEWSDTSLRTYLENDTDIRDLLVVVHDTSGVQPAGPEHPVVKGFEPDHQRLHDMEGRLDGMLKELLNRRGAAGHR